MESGSPPSGAAHSIGQPARRGPPAEVTERPLTRAGFLRKRRGELYASISHALRRRLGAPGSRLLGLTVQKRSGAEANRRNPLPPGNKQQTGRSLVPLDLNYKSRPRPASPAGRRRPLSRAPRRGRGGPSDTFLHKRPRGQRAARPPAPGRAPLPALRSRPLGVGPRLCRAPRPLLQAVGTEPAEKGLRGARGGRGPEREGAPSVPFSPPRLPPPSPCCLGTRGLRGGKWLSQGTH